MEVIKAMQEEHKQLLRTRLIEKYMSFFTISKEEAKRVVDKTFDKWFPNV